MNSVSLLYDKNIYPIKVLHNMIISIKVVQSIKLIQRKDKKDYVSFPRVRLNYVNA